jgi:phosphatidylglycerol lysyltransferase
VITRNPVSKILSRPASAEPEPVATVRGEVSAVLARFGHEAGHYSVLGPDPWQVVWNDDRSGFMGFLSGRRVLVSWRSPVAEPAEQPGLLARLVDYAEGARKPLLALEVNEAVREAGAAFGMTVMWSGNESLVDLSRWSLSGGRRQKLRWARNHARSLGVRWREADPLRSAVDRRALTLVESAWKEARPERRTTSFLRTDLMQLAEHRRYFASEGDDGVTSFVSCTPVNERGWYLQDIVRLPGAPRGSLEGAMALALDTFRDAGYEFASNGPLPFWRPEDGWSDPHELGPLGRRVFAYFDRQYRFSGINQFRSKVEPDRTIPLYVLRTRRLISPGVARSLQRMLNDGDGGA